MNKSQDSRPGESPPDTVKTGLLHIDKRTSIREGEALLFNGTSNEMLQNIWLPSKCKVNL